jgi:hypothetical protein
MYLPKARATSGYNVLPNGTAMYDYLVGGIQPQLKRPMKFIKLDVR